LSRTLRGISSSANEPDTRVILSGNPVYFFFISIIYLLSSKIGILILGVIGDNKSVGILNVLSRFADLVLLPYVLVHMVVPQLFSRHAGSDKFYRRRLFFQSTRLITICAAILSCGMIIAGKFILRFYDPVLEQFYQFLIILCISQFLFSLFGPCTAILMMQGRQKSTALCMFFNVLFDGLLYYILIKFYGLTGAVWATLGASLFYNITMRILVKNHLSLHAKGEA